MAESACGLLLSCEHGGNLVPEPWQSLFEGQEELLASPRGYDIGIAGFARWLAIQLQVPLYLAEVTRLLVELNRSPGHPELYSEFSRSLTRDEQKRLLALHYNPYREAVTCRIEEMLGEHDQVYHVSLHSFAPELHGVVRNADIGLLYDPQRPREKTFCLNWQENLNQREKGWKVRRNYPYRGTADGFVTMLRRCFPEDRYLGFELELNQRWPLQGGQSWQNLQRLICDSLQQSLAAISRPDSLQK
jgi:predicted N-formylglutamate amidohydrolase